MDSASKRRSDEPLDTGLAVRLAARAARLTADTAGLARGYVQGNLVILPADLAGEFLEFCRLNPQPCPVIGTSKPGDPAVPSLAADLDIRTDLPRYRVWKSGEMVDEPTDVKKWWRDDLVSIVIGCSFSFEEALLDAGIPLRHIERGTVVPMYRTNIPCKPAGRFSGPVVTSMRPLKPADAIRAVQITSRYPRVHGAPVHIGLPRLIGVADVEKPDWGDAPQMRADELPVFWACGVTPQAAIAAVKPPFAITHAPGSMLATDLLNVQLASSEHESAA